MFKRLKSIRNGLNAIFTVFGALGLFCIFTLAYIYSNIQQQNNLAMQVIRIKQLSDQIDGMLGNEFVLTSLDDINLRLAEIDEIFENIELNPEYADFLSTPDTRDEFYAFKNAIVAKKGTLNEYISGKAQVTEGILDLSSNIRYTKEIRTLAGFYSRLLLSRFGDIFDANSFAEDVERIRKIERERNATSIDYDFLKKLSTLNTEFQQISSILQRSEQLNIPRKAQNLLDKINEKIADINFYTRFILGSFTFILMAFFARLVFEDSFAKRLKSKAKQVSDILEHTNNNLINIDSKGVIVSVNENYEHPLVDKELEIHDEVGNKIDIISDLKARKLAQISYDFTTRTDENQNLVHEKLFVTPILNKLGILRGASIILHDFSAEFIAKLKLERTTKELEVTYRTDKETGLPNHLALARTLQDNQQGYLLYISIEQFENIQFFYNQKMVSEILNELSKAIALCLETYEFKATLYHIQEDRFCLLYYGDKLNFLIKNLQKYFSSAIVINNNESNMSINIDLCIGSSLDSDTVNTDRLTQAKLAHQRAKQLEEPFSSYEQNNENEKVYRQNQVVSRLIRYALANHKITVECQPIYDLTKPNEKGYDLFSYEILVRMLDEQNKMHYPGEFLNVAKQAGLYLAITKAVIEKAFELVSRFEYRFSINLSSTDMANASVRETFIEHLANCKNPGQLTIEVLETEDVEQNMEAVQDFIAFVREKGCHVAIDDFGSGYANIAMVLQLNIDYIKVDGSIIQRLTYDENSRQFLKMLTNFANGANYTTVAEFVSNQEILDQVKALGVRYAQGYLLGKPVGLI